VYLYIMSEADKILNTLNNEENTFLLKQTRDTIHKLKNDMLQKLQFSSEKLREMHKKLKLYRYVADLTHLKYGSYIRWFKLTNPDNINLTNGGIVIDIKFLKTGCNILCKNNINRLYEIKFDECMIFQKITDQEQVLLDVLSFLSK